MAGEDEKMMILVLKFIMKSRMDWNVFFSFFVICISRDANKHPPHDSLPRCTSPADSDASSRNHASDTLSHPRRLWEERIVGSERPIRSNSRSHSPSASHLHHNDNDTRITLT